ncbi:hypothetical protein [Microlunatus sp. Gsoil 973]|uniref:hypothetical protein n=1 Tax=Microlunatus sp. Gsoil 973 TaxID=2672569 RepID=UPI0012B4F121|nr:hypothetical protein [Microlunatus sp. Gsoil 973]QGN33117.1 hypothetical protein GJV80_10195 [Microlunatus sp. Gsoil 973]
MINRGCLPLDWQVDLGHGGRWTSWRAGDREWLWQNPLVPAAERHRARPGAAFIDAGGAEECFPTIRGLPDHGDAWSRPWSGTNRSAAVDIPGNGTLRRTIADGPAPEITYRIDGRPGTSFLHALHALLAVSSRAVLDIPDAKRMTVLDDLDPERWWPSGLDRLSAADGTAVCAIVPDVRRAVIIDGDDRLELEWDCAESPELCSLMVWRNLGGWPPQSPYRSIGIEPMVGRAADLASAREGSCPVVGPSGTFRWSVRLSAR